ncbi:MAG: DUF4397 domain-containing protein [Chitinophagaceae bacterium]|nr:DUF4397 domain-containing protein [Chitinophagaceae bacterium]
MKPVFRLFATTIMATAIISCKKNEFDTKPLGSLNVVNAVIGGGDVKLNANYRDSAKNYNAKAFALNTGDRAIKLYSTSDSTKPYYLQNHQIKTGGLYSIFLFGNSPSPETIFIEDVIPHYADSVFGVRVINLAFGGTPLNVTVASDPSTTILQNIAYKDLTDFVAIPLLNTVPEESVTFEIRDAGTNDILLTYSVPEFEDFNYPGISIAKQRFKGITLVITGIAGETDGPDAFGVYPAVISY